MFFARANHNEFQSTPSARRATCGFCTLCIVRMISIHALREEGDSSSPDNSYPLLISIHALREEGDRFCLLL